MKRKTRKCRIEINSKRYYKRRIRILKERLAQLRTFEQFECSDFFRGREVAELNRRYYNKTHPRLVGKLNWYLNKLNQEPV